MVSVAQKQVLVSVILPVRNGIETIDKAIASVLRQELEQGGLELLLIDDGSTDGTAAFVVQKYPSVKVISNEGRGVSSARNKGITCSSGKYLALLDADDEWNDGKLSKQVDFLERNPEYALSGCTAEYVNPFGEVLKVGKKDFDGTATDALLAGNFIVTSSVLLRSSVIKGCGVYFDEELGFGEDWHMWLRLSAFGKFHIMLTPGVKYAYYPGTKYELTFLTRSLLKMVDNLKTDPRFARTFVKKRRRLDSIPALARLAWIKQAEGILAAWSEAVRIFPRHPTRFIAILRVFL